MIIIEGAAIERSAASFFFLDFATPTRNGAFRIERCERYEEEANVIAERKTEESVESKGRQGNTYTYLEKRSPVLNPIVEHFSFTV